MRIIRLVFLLFVMVWPATAISGPAMTITDILALPEEEIDLAVAKLTVDQMIADTIRMDAQVARLNDIASEIKLMLGTRTAGRDKVQAVQVYLFEPGPWNDHTPYTYDLSDPMGTKIGNKLLANFLTTKKGNCVSMPLLFVILCQKVGVNVVAVTAPLHIFCRYRDEATGEMWNIEATSGGHRARDAWIIEQNGITAKALQSGIYLQDLTKKETVGLMLQTLYEHCLQTKDYEKAITVCDLILTCYPTNAEILAGKGNAYGRILARELKAKGYTRSADVPGHERAYFDSLLRQNLTCFEKAEDLGWLPTHPATDEKYRQTILNQITLEKRSAK